MALRDDLLPIVDQIRQIPGEMGVHRYQVWVRTRTWSGTRVGLGTPTVTDTRVRVYGTQDPHVSIDKSEDLIAGAQDEIVFRIGPITPNYVTGGVSASTLDPTQTNTPTELVYLVAGPGLPSGGIECTKIKDTMDRPFRYMVWVRTKGRNA